MIKRCQEMVIIIIYCILLITYYLLNQNEIHQHADRNIIVSFVQQVHFYSASLDTVLEYRYKNTEKNISVDAQFTKPLQSVSFFR